MNVLVFSTNRTPAKKGTKTREDKAKGHNPYKGDQIDTPAACKRRVEQLMAKRFGEVL